jgi:hypothetical protein
MKTISRTVVTTLSAGIFAALLVYPATAGCGDLGSLQGPFQYAKAASLQPTAAAEKASARGATGASIVGMWKFQLVSQGDANGNPQIPDGVVVDFGYVQWHNDGTELINSGGHAPATENFCMGVWGQTGYLAFEVNHFPLSYDATTGMLNGLVHLREQVTLSPSGDSYAGTFTIDVYDPNTDKLLQHVAGNVTATRVTVDTTIP